MEQFKLSQHFYRCDKVFECNKTVYEKYTLYLYEKKCALRNKSASKNVFRYSSFYSCTFKKINILQTLKYTYICVCVI